MRIRKRRLLKICAHVFLLSIDLYWPKPFIKHIFQFINLLITGNIFEKVEEEERIHALPGSSVMMPSADGGR